MKRGQAGSALVLVLVALAVLLPLTLILSSMVIAWQRQAVSFRDVIGEEFAARAGLEIACRRLARRELGLGAGETVRLEAREPMMPTARIEVRRERDVVLSARGRLLTEAEQGRVDLKATGMDPEGRVVRQYRRIEVYRVEVEVTTRPSLMGARLRAAVVRDEEGNVIPIGVSLGRGYFRARVPGASR